LGYDHCEVLGNTLEQIAFEKAGIFKPGVPAFTIEQGSESVHQVIQDSADAVEVSYFS
jgi:folylpolyglutamate synthase